MSYDTTRPVHRTEKGGTVSVLDLVDHPTASRCCAWSFSAEGSELGEHVTVLHDEAVASAQAAVRAYMLHKDDG